MGRRPREPHDGRRPPVDGPADRRITSAARSVLAAGFFVCSGAPRGLIVASPASARGEFDRIGTLLKPDFQMRRFVESFSEALVQFAAAMEIRAVPDVEP